MGNLPSEPIYFFDYKKGDCEGLSNLYVVWTFQSAFSDSKMLSSFKIISAQCYVNLYPTNQTQQCPSAKVFWN